MTYGGNGNGKPCVFPFILDGKTNYECIKTSDRDNYWCSTTANYDLNKEWGYCQSYFKLF